MIGMKIRNLGLIIGMVMLSGLATAVPRAGDPAAWQGLTPEQVQRVKKGEIVILDQDTSANDEQKHFIQAAMIFNQPIEKAWPLIRIPENQDRFMPGLDSCRLVNREKTVEVMEFHTKVAMFNIDYQLIMHNDDSNCHQWYRLDPSYPNDLKRDDGYWKLYKLDDQHTLARFGIRVQVSSWIPEFVMERLTKSDLPRNMNAFFKYVDSGGTYTKPGFKEK
jgi:hypothetical protein